MNTTYQAPKTVIIKVETQQIMTTSTVGFGSSVDSASGAESRGDCCWDEDEGDNDSWHYDPWDEK
jgi:hypothetical protein